MRTRQTLTTRTSTWSPTGRTQPHEARWHRPPGRSFERTVRIGQGEATWTAAAGAVLEWGVKTRSGFRVEPGSDAGPRVSTGSRWWLVARLGPLRVREPVEVVAVVERPERVGFAYATLTGHPVSGEEAFIVHRDDDGAVWLTLRSLTAPGHGAWRPLFPATLVAQRFYRARYARALTR